MNNFYSIHNLSIDQPLNSLSEEQLYFLKYGNNGKSSFAGFIPFIIQVTNGFFSSSGRLEYLFSKADILDRVPCPKCNSTGLGKEAIHTVIRNKNISQLESMYIYHQYCYATKGEKVYTQISGKKIRRCEIVAAKIGKEIVVPLQYDGTINSELFELWFETKLLPDIPKKSIIVMDNAAFHRKSRLISIAKKQNHTIFFLPPYSPELNPIENFWSWLKNRLCKILPLFDSFDDALFDCFKVI